MRKANRIAHRHPLTPTLTHTIRSSRGVPACVYHRSRSMPGQDQQGPRIPPAPERLRTICNSDVCDYHLCQILQGMQPERGGVPGDHFLISAFSASLTLPQVANRLVPQSWFVSFTSASFRLADRRSWSTACKEHVIMLARL
jgi:hypothetical protein